MPRKSELPERKQAREAVYRARDYQIGWGKMAARYEEAWYRLGDKIGTPAIDYRNPYDPVKLPDHYCGFAAAVRYITHRGGLTEQVGEQVAADVRHDPGVIVIDDPQEVPPVVGVVH